MTIKYHIKHNQKRFKRYINQKMILVKVSNEN